MIPRKHVPYLSALEMSRDKALYKSTDTLLYFYRLIVDRKSMTSERRSFGAMFTHFAPLTTMVVRCVHVCVQFCSVTVHHAGYDGNIVFNINVSKYNIRFSDGDVPEVTSVASLAVGIVVDEI